MAVTIRAAAAGLGLTTPTVGTAIERLEAAGYAAELTGQRREQAVTRADLPFAEDDEARGIAKYNPLFDWSEPEVWAYLEQHDVPTNALHDKGYPSIGCEPCTRPVLPGQHEREGRWWWELADKKECGLHLGANAE